MNYYRKAAAIFIVIIALTLPFYLEVESEVAVVEIEALIAESQYLGQMAAQDINKETVEAEMMKVIKESAAEYAAANNYSSVVTKHLIYKGGKNISSQLAQKIDAEN
jgi:hypothetical protein